MGDAREIQPKPQHISWNRNFKHPLKYYENLQKLLDARATKKENVVHRRQMLDHMTKNNYRLEMERLRGMLGSRAIRADNTKMLHDRIHRLWELGAEAIDEIQ